MKTKPTLFKLVAGLLALAVIAGGVVLLMRVIKPEPKTTLEYSYTDGAYGYSCDAPIELRDHRPVDPAFARAHCKIDGAL